MTSGSEVRRIRLTHRWQPVGLVAAGSEAFGFDSIWIGDHAHRAVD